MARAVYSHPSIVLVDDALSSADVTTSKKVMSRFFGQNGIVRKTGATVVMTTNKRVFAFCWLLMLVIYG